MSDWLLVHDEGNGWGHERRLTALAKSLEARGAAADVRPFRRAVRSPRVVVDAYTVRADDRALVDAELVVAFDDSARNLAVELVVDPSPGADRRRHTAASKALAGARYAVVDPAIPGMVRQPVGPAVATVLVTFGAADTAGAAAAVAAEIADLVPNAIVELPIGPWWDGPLPSGVRPVHSPDGLAPRLARADLVVSAGGVTLLEALALGRPTIAVAQADNQITAVEHVLSAGAVVASGVETAASEAAALAGDAGRRAGLAGNAKRLVDGLGSDRVAAEILRLAE